MKQVFLFLAAITLAACQNQPEAVADERAPKHNPEADRESINHFLDQWHDDAANVDFAYFEKMADDGIYIGTDKTELWTRDEFRQWSEKYFDAGTGWDFDKIERNIYFSDNGDIAWFDELLSTHMGDCRGSGVLSRHDSLWKIEHYHLSVTVPNDTLDGFIELVRAFEADRE